MFRFIDTILLAGFSGYLTGWFGILIGIFFSFFIKRRGRRFKGTVLGFIGGLMLAIVCFDLLPEMFFLSVVNFQYFVGY